MIKLDKAIMPRSAFSPRNHGLSILDTMPCSWLAESDYPWAERFVGRFPLPPFQRTLCWSGAQNKAFVESIWLGYELGSYMINDRQHETNKGICSMWSDVLIDGQQRINAIQRYMNNRFRVNGYYYIQLHRSDTRRFEETTFNRKVINTTDEALLRDTYNRLNFAGVAHSQSEKA